MKTIKSRTTCKLNAAVLVIYGLVTLHLIVAVGVGAASDPTFTTIDSQEAKTQISHGLVGMFPRKTMTSQRKRMFSRYQGISPPFRLR